MLLSPDRLLLTFLAPAVLSLGPAAAQQAATSFEDAPAGSFTRLDGALGQWRAEAGAAEIDAAHASDGDQCLHLFGGDSSEVELRLAGGARPVYELSFRAERWTRQAPFTFQVEVRRRGQWVEVYDGSEAIQVGGFLTRPRIRIDARIDRLRLRCSSPPGKGVLIDELRLEEPAPMELMAASVFQPVLPVLVGNRVNPVLRLEIETRGNQDPLELAEVVVDLRGTTRPADFEAVELFAAGDRAELGYRDPGEEFGEEQRFGKPQRPAAGELLFRGRRALQPGLNCFWLSVQPRAAADLDGFVDAAALRLRLADGSFLTPREHRPPARQRLGVALRNAGDDGSAAYRIPGLATSNAGTLIAVYDARWKGWGDLPGDVDVGMSRSTDGGRSWEPMRVIMDCGDDPAFRYDGVGDPAVLVDRDTGTIWVMATWSHGDRSWNGSGPGLKPEETGQLLLSRSDDDGLSWSPPINITEQAKEPTWSFLLQGPGRGITMSDGTLVFPGDVRRSPVDGKVPSATVIYSRDHGDSWQVGSLPRPDTTESAVVELGDGELMLNMRDNRGGSRAVMVSDDLGASWSDHPSTRSLLPEPVCMASLIHVGRELDGRADGRLLFSNPSVDRAPRRRMTVQLSSDSGASWPVGQRLLIDEGASAGYSCLTMIDEDTVGILYESSRAHLAFQRLPLQDFEAALPAGYTVPVIDLDADAARQTVVDREPGQYLGHPTTVLLEDGRTIIAVYPKGHGKGPIVMKRSEDGGLSWSERLPVPESWATSKEVPTIYRVVDAGGVRRLVMFSGLSPIRMAVSEDDGTTWSELEPIGDYGGIVANAALAEVGPGEYLSWFHDDGRFIGEAHAPPDDGHRFHLYQVRSADGGLSWSAPEVIASHPVAHLCEPGAVWSPDGETLALLLRENSRRLNSHIIISEDRGQSWSRPRELPAALTGDRHAAVRTADGRLFISFRDTARASDTQGDWCAWVGTWEDIVAGREGQYRVRLKDNRHRWDCAYPGVVLLPDDTIVTTTYGHWVEGEQPYLLSVRLQLAELDQRAPAAGGG